jgi:hypothetical protein
MPYGLSVSWRLLTESAPELAAHAARLFSETHGYAFLATISADGSPRVHPVAPIITPSAVHLALRWDSPKLRDLRRDPRFALHSSVHPPDDKELAIRGTAMEVRDSQFRRAVAQEQVSGAELSESMALLSLTPRHASWTVWRDGNPQRIVWRAGNLNQGQARSST